jgi:FtsP/CotA-like multicopper oxidase with cupredoxin domain
MGQAPGTHWYHAHKHGSVALQLLNGMAGAFIIEGEFDDQLEALMPGLRGTEKVIVIQQLGDTITIQPGSPLNTCAGGDPLPLVNGQLQPVIDMKPGEIQRWRFVNATMQQVSHLNYRFLGDDVYAASKASPTFPANPGYSPVIRQIAYDGIQLAPERYNDPAFGLSQEFIIAPGNRIDILVQAPNRPGKSVLAFRLLHGPPPAGCQPRTLNDLFLLRLNVDGAPVSPAMSFPTAANYPAMPAWLQWDEKDPAHAILPTRVLNFNSVVPTMENNEDQSSRPAIDGKAFDEKLDTTQLVNLNAVEEWELVNQWASSIHPFHIHVNPFQVVEVFDPNAPTQVKLQAPYNWRDTIAIPAAKDNGDGTTTYGRVKIRSRFVDFPGTFVLHCHILDHEDRGMMQEVRVLDPKAMSVPMLPMQHQ